MEPGKSKNQEPGTNIRRAARHFSTPSGQMAHCGPIGIGRSLITNRSQPAECPTQTDSSGGRQYSPANTRPYARQAAFRLGSKGPHRLFPKSACSWRPFPSAYWSHVPVFAANPFPARVARSHRNGFCMLRKAPMGPFMALELSSAAVVGIDKTTKINKITKTTHNSNFPLPPSTTPFS